MRACSLGRKANLFSSLQSYARPFYWADMEESLQLLLLFYETNMPNEAFYAFSYLTKPENSTNDLFSVFDEYHVLVQAFCTNWTLREHREFKHGPYTESA